jgi:hypothetical protein
MAQRTGHQFAIAHKLAGGRVTGDFRDAPAPNGVAQRQRRDWRAAFSIMHHFWQMAPAWNGRAAVRLELVLGGALTTHARCCGMPPQQENQCGDQSVLDHRRLCH